MFGLLFLEYVFLGVFAEAVVVRPGANGRYVRKFVRFFALPLVLDFFAQVPGLEVVDDADVENFVSMSDQVSALLRRLTDE